VALVVTCAQDFAGSVITATNGTDTFTETCPSVSPYTVRFEGIPTGTYTISGVSQGQTFTTQFTVLDYETTLNATPEGATVLPINDVQIWLHCAGIYDKTYTTLNEVLADNTTLLALISDNNAIDYLVRSTEWSGNGKGLVPTMTSDTTPSGEAIGSNRYSEAYSYYRAFDGKDDTYCNVTSVGSYVGYDFEKNVLITKVKFRTYADGWKNTSIIIKGSNDKTTWTDLSGELTTNTANTDYYFNINPNKLSFRYIAMFVESGLYANQFPIPALQFYTPEQICANQTAMGYIGNNDYAADTLLADATWCEAICNSDYFESVLNVKVPTMTSNTTPSGIASANFASTTAWRAFDNDDGTYTEVYINSAPTNPTVGYQFTQDVKINAIRFGYINPNAPTQGSLSGKIYDLQGYNGSSWETIKTITSDFGIAMYAVVNSNKYSKYQLVSHDSTNTSDNWFSMSTLQLYGRT
jgi:hypothetical protein